MQGTTPEDPPVLGGTRWGRNQAPPLPPASQGDALPPARPSPRPRPAGARVCCSGTRIPGILPLPGPAAAPQPPGMAAAWEHRPLGPAGSAPPPGPWRGVGGSAAMGAGGPGSCPTSWDLEAFPMPHLPLARTWHPGLHTLLPGPKPPRLEEHQQDRGLMVQGAGQAAWAGSALHRPRLGTNSLAHTHTYMSTPVQTYAFMHAHIFIHTHAHTWLGTHSCTCTHLCTMPSCTHVLGHPLAGTCALTHTRVHVHICLHTCTCMCMPTHGHAHKHMHGSTHIVMHTCAYVYAHTHRVPLSVPGALCMWLRCYERVQGGAGSSPAPSISATAGSVGGAAPGRWLGSPTSSLCARHPGLWVPGPSSPKAS